MIWLRVTDKGQDLPFERLCNLGFCQDIEGAKDFKILTTFRTIVTVYVEYHFML